MKYRIWWNSPNGQPMCLLKRPARGCKGLRIVLGSGSPTHYESRLSAKRAIRKDVEYLKRVHRNPSEIFTKRYTIEPVPERKRRATK